MEGAIPCAPGSDREEGLQDPDSSLGVRPKDEVRANGGSGTYVRGRRTARTGEE